MHRREKRLGKPKPENIKNSLRDIWTLSETEEEKSKRKKKN